MANHVEVENVLKSDGVPRWKHKLEKWIVSFYTPPGKDQDNGTGLKDSNGNSGDLDLKEKIPEWWW